MGYAAPTDIDPAARALIHHKVRRLVGRQGFNAADADDIEQELAIQCHTSRLRYDPARGTRTSFYERVLSNKVYTLIEHAIRQKRDRRRERPLNDHRVITDYDVADQIDRALDVAECLGPLSPRDQVVANLLVTDSVAEVARWTGSTRGKVRSARGRIAKALVAKNLAPKRHVQQPFSEAPPYVLSEGVNNPRNSRNAGRKSEGLRGSPKPEHIGSGKGAP